MNKTVELLQKLINHEKSARSIGNTAEAEAFASRIQQLLLKHKLDMTDIEFAEEEKNEPIAQDFIREHELTDEQESGKRRNSWVGILLMATAEANFCQVVSAARDNAYHLIGRASDKQIARQLFKYLYDAALEVVQSELSVYRASNEYASQVRIFGKSPASACKTFVSGFKIGFASAIYERLTHERDEARKKLQGANETGLIRLDQICKAVEDFKNAAFPRVRTSSTRTRGHHGYERGKAYGSAIGLSSSPRLTA